MDKRGWLKITLLRLIIAALVCVIFVWLTVHIPVNKAKSIINNQFISAAQSSDSLQIAGQTISSAPRIEDLQTRLPGTFLNYADTIRALSNKLNKLSISYTVPNRIWGLEFMDNSKILKDTNYQIKSVNRKNIDSSKTDMFNARSLMKYQSQVSNSLVNILEYNPADDMAGFAAGSDDSVRRLDLAKKGLVKTLAGLSSAQNSYSDPGMASLISQIRNLQAARDKLASGGDTNSWISAVNIAQDEIITNRKEFWDSRSKALDKSLDNDKLYFTSLERQWNTLKSK